jgi:hypothetical protein
LIVNGLKESLATRSITVRSVAGAGTEMLAKLLNMRSFASLKHESSATNFRGVAACSVPPTSMNLFTQNRMGAAEAFTLRFFARI